ncbi:hypothetical protein SAMN04488103_109104 [Gemmobacter aquatilis]|uniref:Uncharacterized protein n=1 Tax=Gemmobacter aquatilis TaxID=933059 RepID=A0A1H8KK35_9RHOB|nr:hypothetical protein [Gemmobacter aquatilis]SEN92926.1 hypothetical protein SAMN04488103_109104 [Gemmobacter aquatilis]
MLLLIPLLALAVFLFLWLSRRGSSLTRQCLWREHRAEDLWRCAACGAICHPEKGAPRHCLRPR